MAAAKKQTKKDLEDKIAELEAKLTKLSTQLETKPAEPKPAETKPTPKPAETKPAEPKPAPKPAEKPKATLPKGFGDKPAEKAEVPKPKEKAKQLPATFNEALEDAYYTAPMTDFHKYRATVTGYSPSPNRWFVRHTAPVGKVPTSDWNLQKVKVTGYTQPSNQYFATRQRLAYHPADKTFGSFSGTQMTVEGLATKKQEAPKEAPKPAPKPTGTLPKGFEAKPTQTQSPPPNTASNENKSRTEQLEEYEKEYLQRLEKERIEQEKEYQEQLQREAAEAAAQAKARASSTHGSLPKGFEPKPEPEQAKTSRGTLPKGF
ncbi:MAG: trans-sialidase [Nitrosopumilaceae archaeon]|jgi:hypothetical protein